MGKNNNAGAPKSTEAQGQQETQAEVATQDTLPPEVPSDTELDIPQQETETAYVQVRTKVWRGQRIDQRRRAGIVAFPEWAEHEVSQEQLALLEADELIEVVAE